MLKILNRKYVICNQNLTGESAWDPWMVIWLSNGRFMTISNYEFVPTILSSFEFIDHRMTEYFHYQALYVLFVLRMIEAWMDRVTNSSSDINVINCSWDVYFAKYPIDKINISRIFNIQLLRKLLKLNYNRTEIMNRLQSLDQSVFIPDKLDLLAYAENGSRPVETIFMFLTWFD